jgi:hypothetical protein
MGEGRQPERREETRKALRAIKEGALALTVLDWDHIDVLPTAEVDAAIDTMQKLTMRSALVWHGLAQGLAKRTGQSVSGRLQPQIDALTRRVRELTRRVREQQQSERSLAAASQNERDLIEENEQLREKLDRAKALFVDGEVAV